MPDLHHRIMKPYIPKDKNGVTIAVEALNYWNQAKQMTADGECLFAGRLFEDEPSACEREARYQEPQEPGIGWHGESSAAWMVE